MSENSNIQWTDATWNIARGCTKVSPGCKYCYMMRDGERYKYDGKKVIRTKTVFDMPLKYKETRSKVWPGRPLIFTSSLTDFFHPDIDSYRHEAWDIIRKCPHLIFQILTKRPERIMQHLPEDWGLGWDNVWLGTSIENQDYIHRGWELLKVPAKTFFLSMEPLLAKVELGQLARYMDWVIIGGESGHGSVPEDINVNYGYRKCDLEWIRKIIEECQASNVPVFMKQLGTFLADQLQLTDRHGGDLLDPKFIDYPWLRVDGFPERCGLTKEQIKNLKPGDKLIFYRYGGVLSTGYGSVYTFANLSPDNNNYWQSQEVLNEGNSEHSFSLYDVEVFNPAVHKQYKIMNTETLAAEYNEFVNMYGS